MTELVAEALRDPNGPLRAARTQEAIWKRRVDIGTQGVVLVLRPEPALQVLSTPMLVAPVGRPAMNQRVTQRDQAVGIAEWRSAFIEWLGVSDDQGQLVFVQNGRARRRGPEVCRHGQHALSSPGSTVEKVILYLEVQLIDGRLEKRAGCQDRGDHVSPMTADRVRVRVSGAFILELPCECSQVARGEHVVAIETCRDMLPCVLAHVRVDRWVIGIRQ